MPPSASREPPSESEVLGYHDTLSNWGRWGPDDQLGTLNLITPEVRTRAAALVQEGVTVSCAQDLVTFSQEGDMFGPVQRFMFMTGEGLGDEHRMTPPHPIPGVNMTRMAGAGEYMGMVFHGTNITHVDALSHMFWDKKTYNGGPAELVNAMMGATNLAVTGMKDGVVTRGVLIDMPALRGVDWLEAGTGVFPEDLEEAEARQGVQVSEGDAVLLRTGYARHKREVGPIPTHEGQAGWHVASLPWLHERGVSLIGCDTATDVVPSGYLECPIPVHAVGMVAMGLILIDNCDFEDLAATSERLGRYEFLFTLAPLRLQGGTGSPANPIATF
jgi:kynurenine formamidase